MLKCMTKIFTLIALIFIILISSKNVVEAAELSAIGYIDSLHSNELIKGTVVVSGWYLDSKGVSSVKIYIDGEYKGDAEKGLTRPDVKRVFPEYEDGNSGFRYALDTRGLKSGHHTVMVKETSTNGE
ncbi:Ig-like domain-containing protein, partial [Sporolactobacillus terrae]|uniref:Ig-like domain-containing protein n=1 Tax=Sporolactobacillus terrae TaxID=269673 RepID=UPI00056129E3